MTLAEFHAHLATLDWSAKGKRRKAYREAKLLSVLTPDHAALFNAYDNGLSHAPLPEVRDESGGQETGEGLWEDTEPARTEPLPDWLVSDLSQVQFKTKDGIPVYTGRIVGVGTPPRPMDPFPSIIHTGIAAASRPRGSWWRRIWGAGGWLLWVGTVSGLITYHMAVPPSRDEVSVAQQPASQRLTVIKKYTDQVPQ